MTPRITFGTADGRKWVWIPDGDLTFTEAMFSERWLEAMDPAHGHDVDDFPIIHWVKPEHVVWYKEG